MAQFLTPLRVERTDDHKWRLTAPLEYESDIAGLIVVPRGFETDFASVPRLPIAFLLAGDTSHHAAVVHDWLYRMGATPAVSRKKADDVFAEAAAVRREPGLRVNLMWAAVRAFGWRSWKKRPIETGDLADRARRNER